MGTNFAKEFNLYESMFSEKSNVETLTEASSKKASNVVYIWDMYIEDKDKGTFTSARRFRGKNTWVGRVFKTADEAIDAGWEKLDELKNMDLLVGERINYAVDATAIPISEVDAQSLKASGLGHLI